MYDSVAVADPTSLGNILRTYGVTQAQLEEALGRMDDERRKLEEVMRRHQEIRLGEMLISMGYIDGLMLSRALKQQRNLRRNNRAASRSVRDVLQNVTKRVTASGTRSLELAAQLAEV